MIRGNVILLQVLSGLSHSAVHALVDPREEDHHGDEGFQGGFLPGELESNKSYFHL
jgi:hypothetical protein